MMIYPFNLDVAVDKLHQASKHETVLKLIENTDVYSPNITFKKPKHNRYKHFTKDQSLFRKLGE